MTAPLSAVSSAVMAARRLSGRATLANRNYTDAAQTQFGKFLAAVAAEQAAGHQVKVVSFALGSNDLFALTNSPAWNAPGADRLALVNQTLADVEDNYVDFLTRLRGVLPHAQVLLLTNELMFLD